MSVPLGRKYDDPPIKERIIEVHVVPGPTSLPLAKEALQSRWAHFPHVEEQTLRGVELFWSPSQMSVQNNLSDERFRFWSADRKQLLQAGRELFAVNELEREPGWERLSANFRSSLPDYWEIMQPKFITRAVVRYLNRIPFPEGASAAEVFQIFPSGIGEGTPSPFQMVVGMGDKPAGPATLLLSFTGARAEPTYALDLVIESAFSNINGLEAVFTWADKAHSRIIELFEASITDRARELFRLRGQL